VHYYTHNIGDYRKDTAHLTLLEHGIYRQLLDTYYRDEQPLCHDIAKLMRSHSVRSPDEQQALQNVLTDFFVLTEKGFIHTRCDKELERLYGKSASARASAMARWGKRNKESDANALRPVCESDANGMLPNNPITHKPNNPIQSKGAGQVLPEWLPVNEFKAFLDHRKSKRSALTPHAQKLLIEKLLVLQTNGQDLVAVLNQSILNGWSGVFPLKAEFANKGNALTQHNAEVMRDFVGVAK